MLNQSGFPNWYIWWSCFEDIFCSESCQDWPSYQKWSWQGINVVLGSKVGLCFHFTALTPIYQAQCSLSSSLSKTWMTKRLTWVVFEIFGDMVGLVLASQTCDLWKIIVTSALRMMFSWSRCLACEWRTLNVNICIDLSQPDHAISFSPLIQQSALYLHRSNQMTFHTVPCENPLTL